jgi:hypothetical protein
MDGTHFTTYMQEVETYIYRDTSVWNESLWSHSDKFTWLPKLNNSDK